MRRAGRTVAQHEQCLLEAAELPPVGVVSPAVLVERPGNVLDKLVRNVERGSIDPAPDPGPRRRGRRHRLAGPGRLHHRPRPTARRRHRAKEGRHRQDEPDDHALDRSQGGLTTTIHLTRDGKGRPLAIPVTHGQRHDSVCARPLLERIRVPRPGPGRPRCRPDRSHRRQGLQLPRLPCPTTSAVGCALSRAAPSATAGHHV